MADMGYASTNWEAYRVTLLDLTGNFVSSSTGLYVCEDGISLATAFTNQEGTTYQQRAGNGAFCVNRTGATAQTGAQVTLAICKWQWSLMQLLMGGKVAENDDGDIIGWSMPDPDEVSDRRICLEAWTLAIDGENVAEYEGDAAYQHHIFPSVSWIVDDFTLADAVNVFGLVGTVSPNDAIGNGPYNDWPDFLAADGELDGHPTGPWSSYLDTSPPAALCEVSSFTAPGS
jgi:hypothetical protein